MTRIPVTRRELEATRDRLTRGGRRSLTEREREFLLSLKRLEPRWDLIPVPVPQLERLPAIPWKLRNLEQLARRNCLYEAAIQKLRDVLTTRSDYCRAPPRSVYITLSRCIPRTCRSLGAK